MAACSRGHASPARLSAQARRGKDRPAGADRDPRRRRSGSRGRDAGDGSRRHRRRPRRERRPGGRGDSRRRARGPGHLVPGPGLARKTRPFSSARPRRRSPTSSRGSRRGSSSSARARSPDVLGLGGVEGLADWVTLRSAACHRPCEPDHCEVVRLRGRGAIPNVPGLRLVQVGEAVLTSPVLFGDFIAPTENERSRAALSPIYREAPGTTGRSRRRSSWPKGSTGSRLRPRSRRSTAATPGWRRWPARASLGDRPSRSGDVARARSELQTASSSFGSPPRSRSSGPPPRRATSRVGGSCWSAVSPPPSSSLLPSWLP